VSDVVDRVLAALNEHDLDAFVACYAPDATIGDGYDRIAATGHGELRALYAGMFERFPSFTSNRAGGRRSATSPSRRRP
jgi:hypothetical protein